MSSNNNRRKTRNLLINPRFQMKFILGLTLPGVAIIAGYSTIMYRHIKENYQLLVDLSPMTAEAKAQLYSELDQILLVLGGSSLAFLVVMAGLAVVLSHRTAGPLYHFKRVFQDIRDGNMKTRVNLRPSDDFQDVAIVFNEMMDARQTDMQSISGTPPVTPIRKAS